MTAPAQLLGALATRYRLERAASRLLAGAAGGMSLGGLLHYAGAGSRGVLLGLVSGIGLGLLAAWAGERRAPVDRGTVARHLDRALPELEESATLLVDGAPVAGALAALQRRRVEQRLDPRRAWQALPHSEVRRAALVSLPLLLAGAALLLRAPTSRGVLWVESAGGDGARLTLRSLTVTIAPPAYTGLPVRYAEAGDLEVEEGARLAWQLTTAGPVDRAWLIPSTGDSVPLTAAGEGRWEATLRAERSMLVRIRLTHADSLTLTSDDYRLAVRPDRPPVLTVVRPEERTSVDPATLPPVAVEVLANDDYGVDQVSIAATIASGRGEAVRFRRLTIPFAERKRREGHGEILRATLNLKALGLAAGDELYFDVEATDRRTPVPNRARSETMFISVQDPSSVPPADLARLAIGAQPEYFRSQRQLIIDTEKLLADQPRLAKAVFQTRSNELGMDQGLLRLKYGQFLGEEFEEELQPMGGREHAAAEAAPDKQEAPKAGDEAQKNPNQPEEKTPPQKKAAEPFAHRHDDAENATLLGRTVKDKLKEAVGAMWNAELRLRTYEPKQALPYMYRALELIKQVQQDSRVYVQRVGFEPPPIEVEQLRLTGKLKDIGDHRVAGSGRGRDSLPGIREALAALQPQAEGDRTADAVRRALAAAGEELAALAVDDPRLLPLVKDLRQLDDSLSRGTACGGCAARVTQGLWGALPPAEARLDPSPVHDSPLARRFEAMMRGGRR
ncbi:MAG TPA: hypothetical protein VG692_08600 [Gemmatimonadales bacterium]|nr:hypothetical protein [Gemmatimonadales bacterium]